ncbi:MAG: hypothetical protein ACRDDY_14165 [Clostridium sp.]|uniref:hypothetical protein n=1 Tax=Clostridium sp. TaxID=1506 RepID=UPI003EE5EDCF
MDLKAWIAQQPRGIREDLSIVTCDGLYHISTNPDIKLFMPMVGTRQLPDENRTIPRVCCADNLLSAIRGHAAVTGQAINRWKKGDIGKFYIYKLPFKQCIKPGKGLVADVGITNELWVVPNDPSSGAFKAKVIGEFIVSNISEEYEDGKLEHEFTIMIKANELIHVDGNHTLVGYAEMELEREGKMAYNGHMVDELKAISADAYAEKLNALMANVKVK